MLVCVPVVMSHKRKATAHPEGIVGAKRKHLNHDTTICVEHKASLALQPRNGVHLKGPIRRQASLNAEIALQLLLDESPPNSPVRVLNDVYLASFTRDVVPNRASEPAVVHVTPEPTPEPEESHRAAATSTTALRMVHSTTPEEAVLSSGVVSDLPPASTTSSDSDTKEVCVQQLTTPLPLTRTKLKEPVISVVDCKKVALYSPRKPAAPTNTCNLKKEIDYFVKRMASLNARACVTAMIEPERKYARQNHHRSLQQKTTSDPPVEVKSESLQLKPAPIHRLQNSEIEPCRNADVTTTTVAIKSPPPEAYHSDAVISAAPCTVTAVPDGAQEGEVEIVPFNRLGLLYNGRTVHPDTPVFLTSEGMLPARIMPTVVPPKATSLQLMEYAQSAREQQKRKARKPRSQKGDNGWTCLGNPIKTIIRTEGDIKVERKYYVGIRRKDEEVFIRDSIVVKSGRRKQDKPYLAKIASIWQETGNVMMTLFWYYTPDDVEGVNMADFQENEVLASQHHDDNGVACIEDKCYILGYRQYCRYQASVESKEAKPTPLVPGLTENSEKQHLPLETVSQSLVFLCYRGYNHVSGKVCKGIK